MKRRALQVIVFLLLGAIVNVAVAWGCAAWSEFDNASEIDQFAGRKVLARRGYDVAQSDDLFKCYKANGFGLSLIEIAVEPLQSDSGTWLIDFEAGLPLHCINAYWVGQGSLAKGLYFRRVGGIALNQESETVIRLLPMRPLWINFAINTIFYAAVLWVIFFAPFALRRRLRIRRGQCPACAYPIGSSPVCTECGTNLPLPREGEGRSEGA